MHLRSDSEKAHKIDDIELLNKFNKRDCAGFGAVYSMFHRELNLYAASLYRGTNVMSEDIIHDIFTNIWLSEIKYESLISIKAYIYVSIKNGFKNYMTHNTHINKYRKHIELESDFDLDIIECETYSFTDEALKILPKNYKEVLRLYINGWKSGEIAKKLGKTEQNVYNIKNETINILRKKLSKEKLFLIISMFG